MRTFNIEKEFLNKSNCGTGIIYNQETEQFDVSLDIKTDHLIKVTYDELVYLRDSSSLEPGVFYRITDYEFTSTDPEVINAGHRFDIIVLALSENMLSEDARAIQHEFTEEEKKIYSEEEQHYFDTSNLAAWKLKYTIDTNKINTRFAWAPSSTEYGINIINASGNQTLYRNTNKDEGIYYAFSNDNYTYYTTSEEPVEGDQLYIKEEGQIKEVFCYDVWYNSKQILTTRDLTSYYRAHLDANDNYVNSSSGAYTIDRSNYDGFNIIYHNNSEYIVVDENYNYIDEDGTTKTGILVTKNYYRNTWLHNGNSFNVNFPMTFTDYVIANTENNPFSESYTFTLTKLPEIGDTIEVILGDDSYVPYTHITEYDQDIKLNNEITYVRDYTKVRGTIPKNTTYRGTIYGMIDEYENDCEYDFKNALITGRYSLFDPDQFYYTFTNQGNAPSLLKSGDEPILLYPGTYSFLGCIPFRYYEDNPYEYYLRVQGKTQEYNDWDLYAAICDTEGYIDEDTGERHYKVNMYTKHDYQYPTSSSSSDSGNNYMVKIFEDRQWYIKELPPEETNSWTTTIYCKHEGSTEEFNGSLYTTYDLSKYFCHYKGWVYDCDYKHTRTLINLNYNGAHYGSEGSDFDISIDSDTHATGIGIGNSQVHFVTDGEDCYGIHYGGFYNNDRHITWIKQGLPTTLNPSSDSYTQVFETSTKYKFTKPITITEPMYVYLSPYNTTAKYADSYVLGDIMLSPKKIIESGDTGYDLYCTNRDYSELNGDLYAWSFDVVNPKDTSCAYSYYGPDCYRVTLRNSWFGGTFKVIPKVIMDDVQSSTIEAQQVFLQDCYCVKARNGYDCGYPYSDTFGNYWSSDNKLFLRNVRFAELQDVDACTIEDCYCINITRVKNSHIRHYCQALKANDCQNIILDQVDESTVEHCNDIQVYNVWGSHIFKCFSTGGPSMNTIRGLTDSILYNIQNCNINANGPINYPGGDYSKIYINGLKYKDIELSNYLSDENTGQNTYRCVHIRSEEDLTITV